MTKQEWLIHILNGGKGTSNFTDMTNMNILILPGQTLTFAVKSIVATTVSVAVNWSEDI